MTNADKIRNMSDDELAKFIVNGLPYNCVDYCERNGLNCGWICNKSEGYNTEFAMKWLKQEVEESIGN